MAKALYRKYRSKSLDEIAGQSHITTVLRRALDQGKISHAYLLTGPRGVGKTSIARILAHEINKLPYDETTQHLDIIEIDAASNNGVEDVRDLREKVRLAPTSAAKKIYIIDEVHMLSKAAFNALLKTLEEPPSHVVFILATTDADKLPDTIVSRTQQFGFRLATQTDIVSHLKTIAKKEKIQIDDDALQLIALRSDGSFRDSINLLDQLSSLAEPKKGVTAALIEETLGLAPQTLIETLLGAYDDASLGDIVSRLDTAEQSGIDAITLTQQIMQYLRLRLANRPDYLPLLDGLLAVAGSPIPRVKLLTVLGAHAVPKPVKPKSSPLSVATPEPVIKELEVLATKPRPTEPKPLVKKKSSVTVGQVDWDGMVAYTKEHYIAVYSVLSKCGHQQVDDELTIYTVNGFYKKKLDDAKYRLKLDTALEAVGAAGLTINTVATGSPLRDASAAKVAAMMGGGEEVELDDNGS